jgi:uncharacterized membrane protein HdeD (DUF308 family)
VKESYRSATAVFGLVAIVLGVAILVQTARAGGSLGYVLGVLFVALGIGRLYLLRHR